jgi:hypothetical protein
MAVQQAKLTDPAPVGQSDYFGYSVALSGDTALVGAPYKTVGGQSSAGTAYVFTRSGASWSQQAELTPSDSAREESFGYSVALSGDTALIGAPGKAVGGNWSFGAAYVFTGSGASWSQLAELTASDQAAGDSFGDSVALSAGTALVGANGTTVGGQDGAGTAYVFGGSRASWSQLAELSDPAPAAYDHFGSSVALSGGTALIGAYQKTVGGQSQAGAAYIFTGSGASWSQQAELSDLSPAADDWFGSSVALSGDTALVGTPHKGDGQGSFGAAYVFTRSGTTWSQQAKLTASDAGTPDELGDSVTLSGDTALVGAYQKTVGGQASAGAAYVFTRWSKTWSQQAELSDPAAAIDDNFGDSVALSAGTALVGANGTTLVGQAGAGAAYAFTIGTAPTISSFTPTSGLVGSRVTLTGTGFSGASAVSFNGVAAASFKVASDTKITARVPAGATSGSISVTTPDGTATSATSFTVIVTPKLTLILSSLTRDSLKLGKSLTAQGTVTPTSLAGGVVTLTVQREKGHKWVAVTSLTATIGANGAYTVSYTPDKEGNYRTQGTIAKTGTNTAAATTWRAFTVK